MCGKQPSATTQCAGNNRARQHNVRETTERGVCIKTHVTAHAWRVIIIYYTFRILYRVTAYLQLWVRFPAQSLSTLELLANNNNSRRSSPTRARIFRTETCDWGSSPESPGDGCIWCHLCALELRWRHKAVNSQSGRLREKVDGKFNLIKNGVVQNTRVGDQVMATIVWHL